MKKWLIIALALMLALPAACVAETAMGRYVEKELPLPEGAERVHSMELNGEGEIVLYAASNGLTRCVRDLNGAWRTETPDWAALVDLNSLAGFTVQGDDAWVLCYGDEQNDYRPFVRRIRGGAAEDVPLHDLEERAFIEVIGVSEGGQLVLRLYEGGLRVYDPETGRELFAVDDGDGDFLLQGDVLTVLSNENRRAAQYDLATGEMRCEMEDAPLTGEDSLAVDGDAVYVVNAGGIYRVALGGSLWERLVDGNLTSLRMPSVYIQDVAIWENEPVLLANMGDGYKLLRFVYDESVPTLPENELRVYTLGENHMLAQAAAAYQAAHPDYLVSITQLLQEGTAATASDVIRALNAELLAGKGPDVLLLDGMPLSSYVEKGVLADLSDALKPMLDQDELLPGVAEAYRAQDGALRAVPTAFSMPVAIGAAGVAIPRTLDELTALSQDGSVLALGRRTLKGRYEMLLPGSFPAWFDESGALDEDAFAAFLAAVSQINRTCGTDEDAYGDEIANYLIFSMQSQTDAMSFMGGRTEELLRMKNGACALYPVMMDGYTSRMIELTALADMGGTLDYLPGQARDVFVPAGLMGVNAQSGQIEAALDFIKTMLSPEVQNVESFAGLPVNRASFERLVANETCDYEVGMTTMDDETGISVEITGTWPVRATRERVYELARQAKTPYLPDAELLSMMEKELAPFFEGDMDAQTAARAVAAKTRAYLAE